MNGGCRRFYFLVLLLLAAISTLQCIPIEVVYTGNGCDCPKCLDYVVNVPTTSKPRTYTPSEHGYKLDVPPIPSHGKAKVTYTFDFTVQEPKTPPPMEQEKWDLFAKIDRITAHKMDCTYNEGSSSNTCSCNRCRASRRYVSSPVLAFTTPSIHPNALSQTQKPNTPIITWAAVFKPVERNILTGAIQLPKLKSRRRRDISRIFMRNRQRQLRKQNNPKVKLYNKSLRTNPAISDRPAISGVQPPPRPIQQMMKFMKLQNLRNVRNKRDIKGEYDLIEKERDEMDLTLPEIIQFMPETLDPNFKRGQCQFGNRQKKQQQDADEEEGNGESKREHKKEKELKDLGNTLSSVDKEVHAQTDDDDNEEVDDDEANDINSSHAKRNADSYIHSSPFNTYNTPGPALIPYAPSYQPLSYPPPGYSSPQIFASRIVAYPYSSHPTAQQYHPYHIPQTIASPARAMYEPAPPLPPPPPHSSAYVSASYYNTPTSPYPPPPQMPPRHYTHEYQLDSIISDIVNRHPDFTEASHHEDGALVDPPSEQKNLNKSLFQTLLSGKWQRFVIDDYYGAPKYRRESLSEEPNAE